jgi:hypothetical protein
VCDCPVLNKSWRILTLVYYHKLHYCGLFPSLFKTKT